MSVWTSYEDALAEFADTTSVAGVAHIKAKDPKFRKFLWFLVFLTAAGFAALQTYESVIKYYQAKVNVLTEVRFNASIPFPAVTICNLNRIRMDQLRKEVNKSADAAVALEMIKSLKKEAKKRIPRIARGESDDTYSKRLWKGKTKDQAPSNVVTFSRSALIHLAQMDVEVVKRIGHQISTTLISCTFNSRPCSPNNFTYAYIPKFGNCYMFNYHSSEDTILASSGRPGPLAGLSLELFLDRSQYVDELSHEAGFRVVVHDNSQWPFPEDQGINAPPEFVSLIGVKKVEIERLGPKYEKGNCTQPTVRDRRNIFGQANQTRHYSYVGCLKSCYQLNVIEQCDCGDTDLPMRPCMFKDNKTKACGFNMKPQEPSCPEQVHMNFTQNLLSCDCLPSCRDVVFSYTSSLAKWPTEGYKRLMKREKVPLPLRRIINRNSTDSKELMRNIAKVQVYYEEMNHEYIYQVPAYTSLDLASDFGGILGLWAGFTVITAVEVLEFVIVLFIVTCSKICCRSQNKVEPVDEKIENKDEKKTSMVSVMPSKHDETKCADESGSINSNHTYVRPRPVEAPPYWSVARSIENEATQRRPDRNRTQYNIWSWM